jgi:hypothetical protein
MATTAATAMPMARRRCTRSTGTGRPSARRSTPRTPQPASSGRRSLQVTAQALAGAGTDQADGRQALFASQDVNTHPPPRSRRILLPPMTAPVNVDPAGGGLRTA